MSEERVLEKREAIDAILHEHPDARILLATDTPEMEYRFDSIYPGIVKTVGDLPRMHSGSVTSEAGLMRTYLELSYWDSVMCCFSPSEALFRVRFGM